MTVKSSNKYIKFLIPFFLGIITSFSLPPYSYLFINFITFPALLFFFIKNYENSKWISFNIGWVFGFGYFISNLYWITNSLTFDETFKPLIPIAIILIPLFLGIFYGIITLIISFFNLKENFSLIIIFSITFSAIEYIRSFIMGGFPWNLIAYSWTNYLNSIQIISLIGIYSFNLISITVFLLPTVIFYKKNIRIKFFTMLFLFICLLGNYLFGNIKIKDDNESIEKLDFTIKIVSPQIDINRFLKYEDPEKNIEELIALSNPQKSKKTIFIFPEVILTNLYFEDLKKYKKLFYKNYSSNHIIIMGMRSMKTIDGMSKIYNSLVILDRNLKLLAKYDKNKLVPFGEFLPFENYLSKFGLKKITQGYQSFSASNKREIINIYNKKFLPLICYEIIYSGKLKSIEQNFDFIINISEDGWFGNSIGPYQHFSHSKFRAIEEGKYIIRSANNGISAYISPKGKIIHKLESTQKGVIEVKKFKYVKKTFFATHGNKIFFYFLIFYISLFFFINRREQR